MTFYPKWICRECGEKYGKVKPGLSTYHEADPDDPTDRCGWCGTTVNLTQPRDYGYPPQPATFSQPVEPGSNQHSEVQNP